MQILLPATSFVASVLLASSLASQNTYLSEDFRSGIFPPVGWAEINNGVSLGWEDDISEYAFHDDFNGANDNVLLAPALDLSAATGVYLHAVQDQTFAIYMDSNTVEVSLDGGLTFSLVYTETTVTDGAQLLEVDLSAFAGMLDVQTAFRYMGDFSNEWRIDDLTLDDQPYLPPLRWPNLPTQFVSADQFFETFDTLSGVVPPYMAINRLGSVSRAFDPEAWCNIGQLAPCIEPRSGQYALEMGLDPTSVQYHEVANALIIGLDGTGVTNFAMTFEGLNNGEEYQPDDGVFLSTDGIDWVPLLTDWENLIGTGNLGVWTSLLADLSSTTVDVSGQFYLAFSQADDYPYANLDGVGIDDIIIGGGPPLLFDVQNMVAAQTATFTVTGAATTSLVVIAYSLNGPGPSTTPYGQADMTPPYYKLGQFTPDAQGSVIVQRPVPPRAGGVPVWTQALEITTLNIGIFSNSLALIIQ
jgi:hypothetical protein